VNRAELIVGKMLATSAFMSISLLLTLTAFGIVLQFIPLEALGMSANFGPRVVLANVRGHAAVRAARRGTDDRRWRRSRAAIARRSRGCQS
jgi:hypothetical protein